MNFYFMMGAYAVQLGIAYQQVRKGWLLGAVGAIYFLMSMVVFDYIIINRLQNSDFYINYISFTAMPMNGLEIYATTVRQIFVGLSVMLFLCSLGGSKKARSSGMMMTDLVAGTRRVISEYGGMITIALMVLNLLNVGHLISLDIDLLWRNSEYLTIKTANDMGIESAFFSIYHDGFRIIALATIMSYFAFTWKENPGNKTLCLIYSLYTVVILVAGSSRWPVLYGFVAIFSAYAFAQLNARRLIFLGSLTFLSYVYAIYSRSLNDFGVSRIIPNLLDFDIGLLADSVQGLTVNLFEGALNFANSLRISPIMDREYAMLSVSPLPTVIDGFDYTQVQMINQNVPMGGIGEVYFFPVSIQIVYILVLLTFLRLAYMTDRFGSTFMRYLASFTGVWIMYNIPMYSVRTTWKVMVAFTIFLLVWRVMSGRRQQGPQVFQRRMA